MTNPKPTLRPCCPSLDLVANSFCHFRYHSANCCSPIVCMLQVREFDMISLCLATALNLTAALNYDAVVKYIDLVRCLKPVTALQEVSYYLNTLSAGRFWSPHDSDDQEWDKMYRKPWRGYAYLDHSGNGCALWFVQPLSRTISYSDVNAG